MAAARGEGGRQFAEQRLNRLLELIIEAAAVAIGFDGATVTVKQGEDSGTVAATGLGIVALDVAQYADDAGPCLEALETDEPVSWSAEDDEARWRAFQEVAEELGIATSLSLPLPIDETAEMAGSLNLYAHTREQITAEQLELATQYALQLATALQTIGATTSTARIARRAAHTMRSHATVEQAKGFLMARRGVTASEASTILDGMAQAEQTTLRDVATRIIEERPTGEPPTPPG